MTSISIKDSFELMNTLCTRGLNRWIVFSSFNTVEEKMTSEKINDALNYIVNDVIKNLTVTETEKLSVGFKMESEDEIINSIKSVAMETVLNFSVQANQAIDNNNQILQNYNLFS